VWGNSLVQAVVQVVFGDETREVNSLPASMWDAVFPLDAQWPVAAAPTVTTVIEQPLTTVTTTTQQLLNTTTTTTKTTTKVITSLFGKLGGL
jgi:hypothetical protein